MSNFVKLSGSAIDSYFGEQKTRLVKHTKSHTWRTPKKIKWLTLCDECGLVYSRNKATQRAIDRGCVFYRLVPAGTEVIGKRKLKC